MKILFEDKNIIVIEKASGEISQSDKKGTSSLVDDINAHMKTNNEGKKQAYVIHRLDRPVGGIMVYGKTKEAAADFGRQIQSGKLRKKYLTVVQGTLPEPEGELNHYLVKDEASNTSRVVDASHSSAKLATLRYRILETIQSPTHGELNLVEVLLITGRHHQIRVQMSAIGCPIWGDTKYNTTFAGEEGWFNIALFAGFLSFYHPTQNKPLKFTKAPDWSTEPWSLFKEIAY